MGPEGQGIEKGATYIATSNHIDHQPRDNLRIIDFIRIRLLRLDELVQKVWNIWVMVALILPVIPDSQTLDRNARAGVEPWWPDVVDGILVEDPVKKWNGTDNHKVVLGFVGGVESPVKIAAFVEISETLGKGHGTSDVPCV